MLIDDVYDMYLRLSPENELFGAGFGWTNFRDRFEEDEGVVFDSLPVRDRRALALRHIVGQMRRLLIWRQLEISVAESLAHESGARLLVWATKQLAEPAARWALNPSMARTYLSHPISSARRLQRRDPEHKWPNVVAQINRLQKDLLTHDIVAIMPSGIDELRFTLANPDHTTSDLPLHLPELGARWGVPEGPLLWEPTSSDGECDHSAVLNVDHIAALTGAEAAEVPLNAGRRRDSTVRSLEDIIQDQIAARDHLFVEHCRSLLVFRPLIGGRPFSEGVQAEIDHWAQLAQVHNDRRIAFVHMREDIEGFRTLVEQQANEAPWKLRIRSLESLKVARISTLTGCGPGLSLKLLLMAETGLGKSNMLDEGLPDKLDLVRRNLPTIESEARADWLNSYLRDELEAPRVKPSQVLVCAFLDQAELESNFQKIADFLKS